MEYATWFEAQGILDMEDLAVMAAEESQVEGKIYNKLDDKLPGQKAIGTAVKITKLWRACRRSLDVTDKIKEAGTGADLEVPLDEPTKSSLTVAWTGRHNFSLSDARLLVEPLLGRVYREITATPPKFPVLFLEQLRTMASLERKTHVSLLVKAGEAAKGQTVIADAITGSFELFVRGRALMSTVAYASVHKPAWFNYEDAEFFSEKILAFINQEFRGQRPPLAFYVNAWASTMQRWSEAVRTNKEPLSNVVRATSGWEHLWTMWQPVECEANDNAPIFAPPDNRELVAEVERMRKLAAQYQSERDLARQQTNYGQRQQQQQQTQQQNYQQQQQQQQQQQGGPGGERDDRPAHRRGGKKANAQKRKFNGGGGGNARDNQRGFQNGGSKGGGKNRR